ncbi:MAG TPA: radical SAM protein [Holophaga sp.]|nr:radical SAM protein [Holophaga sp.]HPS66615.1 radical SAM protein [Holophaga sp.]
MTRIAFITPPLIKPAEPGLSAAAAARWLQARGVDAHAVDASIGWYRHLLEPRRLEEELRRAEAGGCSRGLLSAFRQAARGTDLGGAALRRPATYLDRRVYSSAANQLVNALRLASFASGGFRLRVADVEVKDRRPHRSEDLEAMARTPGPFDAYYLEDLIPRLAREGTTHAALSFTFLNQAFAGFRLAFLLQERLPSVLRLAGGPLMACWSAVGAPLAFPLFDRVFPTSGEAEMEALARELGGTASGPKDVLAPDFDDISWEDYLAPMPIVPVALGRGCYWRRCTFCPDYLHPAHRPGGRDALPEWLEKVAARFPEGAMLHLTDSALSPALLDQVAEGIQRRRLPLRWHGFARMEARFADPDFMRHLAEGGCAMLQWGLETASPRLLAMMDKGVSPGQARQVLRSSAAAGIKNHAYLLFGLPTESDADREETLAFVQAEAASLHDLNASLLNLPKRSPMHEAPERYGITRLSPFGADTDLSLYSDFHCGASHPRLEARHWLAARFFKDAVVKGILGDLNAPFKENHACFLPR